MKDKPPVEETIAWDGGRSVARVSEALRRGRAVQIELSTELHEAALCRLVTDEDRDAEPVLEIRGGHELVDELADVDALAAMAELTEPVRDNGYRIAVTSAAPVIFIEPSPGSDERPPKPAVTVPYRTPRTV